MSPAKQKPKEAVALTLLLIMYALMTYSKKSRARGTAKASSTLL